MIAGTSGRNYEISMDRTLWVLIISNVLMTSFAQIILKGGMSTPAVTHGLADGLRWASIPAVATSPLVLLGMFMYFGSALIWLIVLSRIEVSLAYPFVGLGFLLTMVLGWAIYGDSLSLMRVAGTLMIAAGVAMLARS